MVWGWRTIPRGNGRGRVTLVSHGACVRADWGVLRCTAALSDGERLFAIRYGSNDLAPTLYYQSNATWQGWALVSELYGEDAAHFVSVPSGSFCSFDGDQVEIALFVPTQVPRAAA